MAPCCHRAQCPQVTHWEGTATAGALGAQQEHRASHKPHISSSEGRGSTGGAFARPSALLAITCCPALQPGPGSAADPTGSHPLQPPRQLRGFEDSPGEWWSWGSAPGWDNIHGAGWGHSRRIKRGRAQAGWPRAPKSRGQQDAPCRCECTGNGGSNTLRASGTEPRPHPLPSSFSQKWLEEPSRVPCPRCVRGSPTRAHLQLPGFSIHRAESNSSPVPTSETRRASPSPAAGRSYRDRFWGTPLPRIPEH